MVVTFGSVTDRVELEVVTDGLVDDWLVNLYHFRAGNRDSPATWWRDDREAHSEFTVAIPRGMEAYEVEKGSVALDGVSLTVASCTSDSFTVALIPHTLEVTTLGAARPGSRFHYEADVLAKYVQRMLPRARTRPQHGKRRVGQLSWREVVPLPSRFWIRHLPRRWREADEPRLDLCEHRIVWPPAGGQRQAPGERLPAVAALADVAWVPPVRKDRTREKGNLVLDLVAARVPVLDQFSDRDEETPAAGTTTGGAASGSATPSARPAA